MMSGIKGLTTIGLLAVLVGCYHDRPHDYGQQRPPVDRLDSRDSGLQSKDVIAASDQMAMDLLALPELNASREQWTIVVDRVENMTAERRNDLDVFVRRVGVQLANRGRGRVQLIQNRDYYRDIQSRELEPTGRDEFGQGSGGRPAPGGAGIQPQYSLNARMMEMPNRATSYFFCEFSLNDLSNRRIVWTNSYEVKVAN